jgi:hypothetical protein
MKMNEEGIYVKKCALTTKLNSFLHHYYHMKSEQGSVPPCNTSRACTDPFNTWSKGSHLPRPIQFPSPSFPSPRHHARSLERSSPPPSSFTLGGTCLCSRRRALLCLHLMLTRHGLFLSTGKGAIGGSILTHTPPP